MHLSDSELAQLLSSGTELVTPNGHLAECESCRVRLEELRSTRTQTVSPHVRPAALGDELDTLDVGQRVGRYVLVDRLGAGGMGLVYAAFDPTLARRVAIKVLRVGSGSQAHLLAEAQLLAKLRHPHVVSVHDVGTTDDGRLFMTLDYIEGKTARAWLLAAPRSADDVVALFVQAGRGLAEAHRLGIVHRDFKPENVLVDAKGHAYVLDFGIALDSPRSGESPAADDSPARTAPGDDLTTRAGFVKGTPPYLPPEAFTGQRADERSDQFSFCISVYEGLTGVRPFNHTASGDARWQLRPPPDGRALPSRVRAALLRGLALDPAERWPSMDALLDALTPPESKRAWLLAAAAVVLAAGVGLVAWQRPDPCTVGAQAASQLQSDEARQSTRARFAASGVPGAAETYELIATSVDQYTQAWGQAYESACRGPENGDGRTLTITCLEQRRTTLRRLIATLAAATPGVVDRAVELVSRLPDLAGCADVEALRRSTWVGRDAEARKRADALRARLEELEWDIPGARQEDYFANAHQAELEARALNHQELLAKALILEASETADRHAKFDLRWRGFVAANAARDYRLQLSVAHDLIVEAFNTGHRSEARSLVDFSEAAYLAAGEPPELKLDLLRLRAASAFASASDAEQPMRELLAELTRRNDLAARMLRGVTWNNFAVAVGERQERFDEALEALDRSIAADLESPRPIIMNFVELTNFVEYAGSSGQFERGRRRVDEYRALEARAPDVPGDVTCQLELHLANIERYQGHVAQARAGLDAALACAEKHGILETPFGVLFQLALSDVERQEGHVDQALAAAERAVALATEYTGADSYDTARAQVALAQALLDAGDARRAVKPLEVAEAFTRAAKTSERGLLVPGTWRTRGAYLVATRGDPVEARQLLERARAAFDALHHSAAVARVDAWLAKVR